MLVRATPQMWAPKTNLGRRVALFVGNNSVQNQLTEHTTQKNRLLPLTNPTPRVTTRRCE